MELNLLEQRELLLDLKSKLKVFEKFNITDKLITKEAKDINLDLKYSQAYIREAIDSLTTVEASLYHVNLFLENFKNKNTELECEDKTEIVE